VAGGEICVTGYKKKCCPNMSLKCEDKKFTGLASIRSDWAKRVHCQEYGDVIGRDCIYKSNSGGAFDFSGKCVEINT
jgi:hypothetical protein